MEAYFEVVHNERGPFVVHTSTLDVEVAWEQNLDVETYSARKIFETSILMEGKVKVKLPHDDKIPSSWYPIRKRL